MEENRKKKSRNNNPHWRLPLTIEALAQYGALDVEYASGAFDAHGPWQLTWEIWLLTPNIKESSHHGYVQIKKSPVNGSDTFNLSVEQQIIEQHSLSVQKAEITCLNDRFATPVKWTKNFDVRAFDSDLSINRIGLDKKGSLQGNQLVDGQTRKKIAVPVSCNWCLPDALQRLSLNGAKELPFFTLLDELEKIKEEQQVRFLGQRQIPFAGMEVTVKCYQHTGRGMLPYFYYIDLQGRLLVALSGLQAFILNPQVKSLIKKRLKHR